MATTPFEGRTKRLVTDIELALMEKEYQPAHLFRNRIQQALATFRLDPGDPVVEVKEADRIELLKETAAFLQELFDAEILMHASQEDEEEDEADNVPFDVSSDRAEQLAARLRGFIERERRGIHEDHPLVKCTDCGQVATHCEFGNSYCPSCGHSLDGAPEVEDDDRDVEVISG
jgi:hypothetical protein